jgi:hypothetical protein
LGTHRVTDSGEVMITDLLFPAAIRTLQYQDRLVLGPGSAFEAESLIKPVRLDQLCIEVLG